MRARASGLSFGVKTARGPRGWLWALLLVLAVSCSREPTGILVVIYTDLGSELREVQLEAFQRSAGSPSVNVPVPVENPRDGARPLRAVMLGLLAVASCCTASA